MDLLLYYCKSSGTETAGVASGCACQPNTPFACVLADNNVHCLAKKDGIVLFNRQLKMHLGDPAIVARTLQILERCAGIGRCASKVV